MGGWAEKLHNFQKDLDLSNLTLSSLLRWFYSASILFVQYLKNIGLILEMDGDTNGQLNNKKLEIFWRSSSMDPALTSICFSVNLPDNWLRNHLNNLDYD